MSKKSRLFLYFSLDLLLLGVFLCIFALFHHVLPRSIGNLYGSSISIDEANKLDFSSRFPDRFTTDGSVVSKDGFYMDSENNITLKTVSENNITYHVAEFYVRHITALRTAMASDTFTTGIAASVLEMGRENNAILAVSGDYFGIRERGVVIRNGEIYRKNKAHEICVLYCDGTMETYSYGSFDIEKAIAGGAWQAWDFGPALLDADGRAIKEFKTGIAGKNPRIAIGYYEPGHYVLVAVDGRQKHSEGMSLEELASLFESMGCKRAYNLDGGHSAVMTYEGEIYSSPSKKGGRDISDIIYLAPGSTLDKKEEE
jgi:exopolysaccharide biosynthesis protein